MQERSPHDDDNFYVNSSAYHVWSVFRGMDMQINILNDRVYQSDYYEEKEFLSCSLLARIPRLVNQLSSIFFIC